MNKAEWRTIRSAGVIRDSSIHTHNRQVLSSIHSRNVQADYKEIKSNSNCEDEDDMLVFEFKSSASESWHHPFALWKRFKFIIIMFLKKIIFRIRILKGKSGKFKIACGSKNLKFNKIYFHIFYNFTNEMEMIFGDDIRIDYPPNITAMMILLKFCKLF